MRSRCLTLGAFVLFLTGEFPLSAQYPGGYPPGGYPPGGYPPGTYPPGSGPGIPMPRRGKKKSKKEDDQTPLSSMKGMLRKLDDQSVMLEAEDARIVNLKRTSTTKFMKDDAEMKPSALKPGDHVEVEYREGEDGYLFAVNVLFEKEGTAEERAKASEPVEMVSAQGQNKPAGDDERPVQRRKDPKAQAEPEKEEDDDAKAAPAPAKSSQAPAKASTPPAELPPIAPPDAGLDLDHIPASTSAHLPADDDSAPHPLKRGKPKEAPQQVATNYPPAETAQPASAPAAPSVIQPRPLDAPPRPAEPVAVTERPPDPRIEKAREAAATFTESLPNYVCQEQMARFASQTHVVSWQPIDIVSTEVVYENGKERYRNVAVNGKATKKKIEDLGGAWSTGEFGSVLMDVLSPATAADFRFRKRTRIDNREAYVFDLDVDHEHSHWHIEAPSQYVLPAYRGSIWIDKESSRVLRIEMQAYQLPEQFPFDKVESATDYEFIRIGGDHEFLLPVHAETLTCERGTNNCSRNVIDFRNYHKYAGEAEIKFEK
ncbi:MAG TPA: hypothetical protein VMT32_16650 [Bryobacteraceae bacterium]|nr:hypothetical protein [Bryobacteraceae bacterium]